MNRSMKLHTVHDMYERRRICQGTVKAQLRLKQIIQGLSREPACERCSNLRPALTTSRKVSELSHVSDVRSQLNQTALCSTLWACNRELPSSRKSKTSASPPPTEKTAHNGSGPPHYRGFTITFRHATLGRAPLDE